MTQITISHSEAENYALCERKHFYGYGLGLQKKGTELPVSLYRGIVGHDAFKAYYEAGPGERLDAAFAAIDSAEPGPPTTEEVKNQLCTLFEMYDQHFKDERLRVLKVESSSLYPLIDDDDLKLYTHIRPDIVVEVPGEGIQVWDHKFVYDFKPQIELEINPQVPKYIVGLRAEGIRVKSGYLNQVRYRDLKSTNPADYFKRAKLELSDRRLEQTFREHANLSGRIAGLKSQSLEDWEANIVRTANVMVCKSCSFKDLCANDIHGRSRDLMVKHYYEPKKPRTEMVEDAS